MVQALRVLSVIVEKHGKRVFRIEGSLLTIKLSLS